MMGMTWISRDHPRVGGEHGADKKVASMALGSSPRRRGARQSLSPPPYWVGIIPA